MFFFLGLERLGDFDDEEQTCACYYTTASSHCPHCRNVFALVVIYLICAYSGDIMTAQGQQSAPSSFGLSAEEDPRRCHRQRRIAQTSLYRGMQVPHVRGDGSLGEGKREPERLSLFKVVRRVT